MDEKRLGEIALAIERMRLEKDGTGNLNPSAVNREFGNIAKATGISVKDLKAYSMQLVEEALTKIFADSK